MMEFITRTNNDGTTTITGTVTVSTTTDVVSDYYAIHTVSPTGAISSIGHFATSSEARDLLTAAPTLIAYCTTVTIAHHVTTNEVTKRVTTKENGDIIRLTTTNTEETITLIPIN